MKKIARLGLFAFALALFFNAFAVTETNAQGVVNEILKRMQKHRDALSSLRTDVTMGKHDALLDDYDITKGKAYYLPQKGRDAYVRIDWTEFNGEAFNETLAVANGEYILYRPRLKQAIVGQVKKATTNNKANSLLGFMNMSKAQLKANYSYQYLGVEKVNGSEMWHLKLNPKKNVSYKYADLWVDGNGMPRQSRIVEDNNDSTTILLYNLVKNRTIKASVFKVNLPSGTKIIRD